MYRPFCSCFEVGKVQPSSLFAVFSHLVWRFPPVRSTAAKAQSGEFIICEHGNQRVTRMEKNGTKTALATHFNVSSFGSIALGILRT